MDENLLSCYGNHLKRINLLDKEFHVPAVSNGFGCDTIVVIFREQYYDAVSEIFRKLDYFQDSAKCIVDFTKTLSVAELSMKQFVYDKTKKLLKRERDEANEAIGKEVKYKINAAVNLCMIKSMSSEAFTSYYSSARSSENDTEEKKIEDYCLREYLIKGNFVNNPIYRFVVNPYKINVTVNDCNKSVRDTAEKFAVTFRRGFENQRFSRMAEECFVKTSNKHKIFELCAKVELLGEIAISGLIVIPEEAIAAEKRLFIQLMSKMFEELILCFL